MPCRRAGAWRRERRHRLLGADTQPLWVEIATLLRSWLPQVEECTVEGAGHLLQIQRPEAVARGLADFFDRHPMEVA